MNNLRRFYYIKKIQNVNKFLRRFRLCNYQGKFSGMHTYRWEPNIEGSIDGENWKRFRFKYACNEVTQRPAVILFHLPRLDWRIWFLPLYAKHGIAPKQWFKIYQKEYLSVEKKFLIYYKVHIRLLLRIHHYMQDVLLKTIHLLHLVKKTKLIGGQKKDLGYRTPLDIQIVNKKKLQDK